ncbi:hypothetical protein DLJ47_23490, partial [Micromonospora sp. S4605]
MGAGAPLVCLPGGPMQAAAYLGDLGGLPAHRELVLLDLRGTGASAVPTDPASYRFDRQVADVEALRRHLGLDRLDLVTHSAGAALALCYRTAAQCSGLQAGGKGPRWEGRQGAGGAFRLAPARSARPGAPARWRRSGDRCGSRR